MGIATTTASTPLYLRTHPDFAGDTMPAIPASWTDMSWQNDACPRFRVAGSDRGRMVSCWIEREEASERESGCPYRFILSEDDGAAMTRMIHEGDDFAEVERLALLEALAFEFAATLQNNMELQEWAAMRFANRSAPKGVCASHDYRDSNMDMHEAFLTVMGRDAIGVDGMSDADTDLWNAAWAIATPHYLTSDADGMRFDVWRMTGRDMNVLRDAGHDSDECGRAYSAGYIENHGAEFIVTVSNLSESFVALAAAEQFLWDHFAQSVTA